MNRVGLETDRIHPWKEDVMRKTTHLLGTRNLILAALVALLAGACDFGSTAIGPPPAHVFGVEPLTDREAGLTLSPDEIDYETDRGTVELRISGGVRPRPDGAAAGTPDGPAMDPELYDIITSPLTTAIDCARIGPYLDYGVMMVLDPETFDVLGRSRLVVTDDCTVTPAEEIMFNGLQYPEVLIGVALWDDTWTAPLAAGFEYKQLTPGFLYEGEDLAIHVQIFAVVIGGARAI